MLATVSMRRCPPENKGDVDRWLVVAMYIGHGKAFSAEKLHDTYGAAVASLVEDTPNTITLQLGE